MLSKPFGKCSTCRFRNKCVVETESLARVQDCVYQDKFQQSENSQKKVSKLSKK